MLILRIESRRCVLCLFCVYVCAGLYFTGDEARRDEDGHYEIMGRVDDVLNPKGHRLDTAEVEGVLVSAAMRNERARKEGSNHDMACALLAHTYCFLLYCFVLLRNELFGGWLSPRFGLRV